MTAPEVHYAAAVILGGAGFAGGYFGHWPWPVTVALAAAAVAALCRGEQATR